MKTPPKGFTQITVSDKLKRRLKCTAEALGLSMPDLIRRMLGDLESEHPDQEGTGKSEKKLKPEEYKALLLLIADGLKKSAEDCVIDSMMVDMENKVVPVYDYGKREPVTNSRVLPRLKIQGPPLRKARRC